MPEYSYTGNEYSEKNDYIDDNSAEDINNLQDEVEAVEQVLTGGVEGQALVADPSGKAVWGEGGGGGGGYCCWLVEVTLDWDASDENIAADIINQTDLTIPVIGDNYFIRITVNLLEEDISENVVDYANAFEIAGSCATGTIINTDIGDHFNTMPAIGTMVRVCYMSGYIYFSPPPP